METKEKYVGRSGRASARQAEQLKVVAEKSKTHVKPEKKERISDPFVQVMHVPGWYDVMHLEEAELLEKFRRI